MTGHLTGQKRNFDQSSGRPVGIAQHENYLSGARLSKDTASRHRSLSYEVASLDQSDRDARLHRTLLPNPQGWSTQGKLTAEAGVWPASGQDKH
jgi:hypothetical protein